MGHIQYYPECATEIRSLQVRKGKQLGFPFTISSLTSVTGSSDLRSALPGSGRMIHFQPMNKKQSLQ